MTAIPKEIVKNMEIRDGDNLLWVYNPSERSTILIKSPASSLRTINR
jgi:bifunctional DNA-binding transcriptional regulator/antitoxin component of YhaV-PrlF toxin-antitoxin module